MHGVGVIIGNIVLHILEGYCLFYDLTLIKVLAAPECFHGCSLCRGKCKISKTCIAFGFEDA